MPSAEIRRHWNRVAELGCIITHRPNVQRHHCKGGSMIEIIGLHGTGLKVSDWLVIPLCDEPDVGLHQGKNGIENGVETWERCWGTQVDFLDKVSIRLGYNVWTKAGIDRPEVDERIDYAETVWHD